MLLALQIAACLVAPSAILYAAAHLPAGIRWVQRTAARVHPPPPVPQGPPIERLAADLRRISASLDALVAAGPIPGRILRYRSTAAAYDQTLLLACRALDVEPAGRGIPLSSEERLQTEAALASAGLVW